MNEWILVFYAAVGLIFILIIFLLALYVIGKLRKILPLSSAFGVDAKSRLLGLGVGVILFPTVIPQLVSALVSMFVNIIRNGSAIIFEDFNRNANNCTDDNMAFCGGQIGLSLVRAISTIFDNTLQSLYQIPVNRLILLLGVWAFTAYLIDKAQDNNSKNDWVKRIFDNRNSVTVKNTVFFMILMSGAYLSIAAIAAIPQLQEKNVIFQEIGAEKLKLQLENSYNAFEKKYPSEVGNKETFNKLDEFLKSVEIRDETSNNQSNTTPAEAKPTPEKTPRPTINIPVNTNSNTANTANTAVISNTAANTNTNTADGKELKPTLTQTAAKIPLPRNIFEDINFIAREGKQGYEDAIKNYKKLLNDIKESQRTTKDSAAQNYETSNLVGKGNKERVKYYLEIIENYNEQANILDQRLSICLVSVQDMDNTWRTFVDTLPSLSANQSSAEFITSRSNTTLYEKNFRAQRDCQYFLPPSAKTPARPLLGEASELGIFGFVAGWLLKTESLPLALITGLMGFGLLGSACSTFIRERLTESKTDTNETTEKKLPEKKPKGLLVSDLTAVIIRGVSAAIVVFLAVEGGLAIFAAGGGEPNPYVLLLTCLVAAVFSETIWGWAEKELSDKFKKKDKENNKEAEAVKPSEKCNYEKPATESKTAASPPKKTVSDKEKDSDEKPKPK